MSARSPTTDFSPVFLRNATAYGVSPRLRGDIVVNNLVGYAITQGDVLIQSDGTPWRPLVHVEDIARAFLAALEAPRELIHNQAFNVGTERGQSAGPGDRRHGEGGRAGVHASGTPRAAGPTRAATGWIAARSPGCCRRSGPNGRWPRASRSCTRPIGRRA